MQQRCLTRLARQLRQSPEAQLVAPRRALQQILDELLGELRRENGILDVFRALEELGGREEVEGRREEGRKVEGRMMFLNALVHHAGSTAAAGKALQALLDRAGPMAESELHSWAKGLSKPERAAGGSGPGEDPWEDSLGKGIDQERERQDQLCASRGDSRCCPSCGKVIEKNGGALAVSRWCELGYVQDFESPAAVAAAEAALQGLSADDRRYAFANAMLLLEPTAMLNSFPVGFVYGAMPGPEGYHFDCGCVLDAHGRARKTRPPLTNAQLHFVNFCSWSMLALGLWIFPELCENITQVLTEGYIREVDGRHAAASFADSVRSFAMNFALGSFESLGEKAEGNERR
eukprot:Skav222058  [mRNA]  locus=scaffold707:21243:30377:- [translate_table: standard]